MKPMYIAALGFGIGLFSGVIIGYLLFRSDTREANARVVSSNNAQTNASTYEGDLSLIKDIEEEATNPLSPIKFDVKLNEYQLVYGYSTNGITHTFTRPLHYSPWTGKKLPPSKRPKFLYISPIKEAN